MRTYDIINAGPRNRFVANGVVVSNSGRMIQPQNWPSRGLLPQREIDSGATALKSRAAYSLGYDVMKLTSSAIRSAIKAPAGKRLCVADLAAIEGRVGMWLTQEEWELDAYREFDFVKGANGLWVSSREISETFVRTDELIPLELNDDGEPIHRGPDLYKLTYAKAFGVPPETVAKAQRQIGKVMLLALEYGGGVGAFATFAAGYGIDLAPLATLLRESAPESEWQRAADLLAWHRKSGRTPPEDLGMADDVWLACQILVNLWRDSHPMTKTYWRELDDTVREAIDSPGRTLTARRIKVRRDGAWLRLGLPSGRALCYPQPALEKFTFRRKKKLVAATGMDIEPEHEESRTVISFSGKNQVTQKWCRVPTAGPKLFENMTQGLARDVFVSSWLPAEEYGYEIIGRVHDELVTEAPDNGRYTGEKLAAIMAVNPVWAPDLPLAAAGETMYWYRK